MIAENTFFLPACTYSTLCVTVLTRHGEVEAEFVRLDDLDVTRLRATEGVDAAVEVPVGHHLHHDARVLAVHGYCSRGKG